MRGVWGFIAPPRSSSRTTQHLSVQPSGIEAAAPNCRTRCPSIIKGLHLCDAAIHEQFYSRDSSDARDHGLGDLIGCAEPAERNGIGNQFLLLLAVLRSIR